MKARTLIYSLLIGVAFLVGGPKAFAQWKSQSFTLVPGWNAVYFEIDATYTNLDTLVGGNANNPITEIWKWQPAASTVQFVETPQAPTTGNSQWVTWIRDTGVADTLTLLPANAAYLVRNNAATNYAWSVTGSPTAPSYKWTVSGLNFIGFPTFGSPHVRQVSVLRSGPAVQRRDLLLSGWRTGCEQSGPALRAAHYSGKERAGLLGSGRFVAARLNRTIQLVERGRKAPLLTIPLKGVKEIKAVRFADGDRRLIAVASAPRGTGENEDWLLAWDAQSGKFAQGLTNHHTLVALAVASDGSRVAVGGGNKEIAVYDGHDLKPLLRFRAHDALITALAFHPTRPVIASCSKDFSVKVWNYETGQLLDTFLGPTRRPGALSFSASGRLLACNSADNVTRIWKLDAAGLISAADAR